MSLFLRIFKLPAGYFYSLRPSVVVTNQLVVKGNRYQVLRNSS
ncbi:hypothetical protein [Niastella vici]|nr:hypothetical protein [Niastella vici]